MRRTGLRARLRVRVLVVSVLALLAGCTERRSLDTWPQLRATVSGATSSTPTLRAELPAWDDSSSYGARQSSCESFRVLVDDKGNPRHRRLRKPWSKSDQQRFRGLVGMVAQEMGAEPRLLQAWALRESTYRPSALHVLNPDVQGATNAWRKYAYDEGEESRLVEIMERSDAQSSKYWDAKGKLARIRRFKGNPHLFARVRYDQVGPDGEVTPASGSAWAFGYGPFGFNPAYFVQVWDAKAPPWVFCESDGLAAIVTAIWSARAHQRECAAAGFGDSYLVLNHRLGRGHCAPPDPESNIIKRLARVGLDANKRARLGRAHPQASTDRTELLAKLRRLATERGLLSAAALGRGPA